MQTACHRTVSTMSALKPLRQTPGISSIHSRFQTQFTDQLRTIRKLMCSQIFLWLACAATVNVTWFDPVAIHICHTAPSPGPATGGQPRPIEGLCNDRVDPCGPPDFLYKNRRQYPAVKTSTAGAEAFQAVDGGQAGLGIVEYEQLPVHDAPAARGAFGQSPRIDVTAQAYLRGRVGYGVCGSFREDILLRYLEKRDAIGPDVEVSANQRLFNRQHAPTVAVVVRVPAFERAVDEEADRRSGRGLIRGCRICRRTNRRRMPCFATRPALLDRPRQRFGAGVCALCHRRTPLCALLYDTLSICCPGRRYSVYSGGLRRSVTDTGVRVTTRGAPTRRRGVVERRRRDGRWPVSLANQDSLFILTGPP